MRPTGLHRAHPESARGTYVFANPSARTIRASHRESPAPRRSATPTHGSAAGRDDGTGHECLGRAGDYRRRRPGHRRRAGQGTAVGRRIGGRRRCGCRHRQSSAEGLDLARRFPSAPGRALRPHPAGGHATQRRRYLTARIRPVCGCTSGAGALEPPHRLDSHRPGRNPRTTRQTGLRVHRRGTGTRRDFQ